MNVVAVSLTRRDLPLADKLGHGPRLVDAAVADAALAGGGAILLWALWPILAVGALAVPPFLLLAIAFACGFLAVAVRHRLRGNPVGDLLATPLDAVGLLGFVGSQIFWLLALRLAFPIDGTVASAPWPVLGAVFGDLIGQPQAGTVGGASLGGLLAVGGALCWVASGKARRRRSGGGSDPLGGLCGLAAPICLVLHLCLEPRLPLDAASLLAAAAIGLGPIGIAGALWDRATRGGGVELLSGPLSAARRRGAGGR